VNVLQLQTSGSSNELAGSNGSVKEKVARENTHQQPHTGSYNEIA
jgi:hypothetical protein